MKIAFVIDTIAPFYVGGYEKRAFELAHRLGRRHDVTVFTSAPSSQTMDGVRFVAIRPQVATFRTDGYRSTKEASLFAAAVAVRAMRGIPHFDIVDCNSTPYLHIPSALLLARCAHARLVLTVHEALSEALDGYFRGRGNRLGKHRLRVLQKGYMWLHSLPDAVIAASDMTATELEHEGISSVATTHGGVSTLGTPNGVYRGRLICLGRLVPPKRVDVAIDAFALAHANGHAKTLTIIGDGPELPALRRRAEEHGLRDAVHFSPGLTEEDKHRVLHRDSDVYLSASLREGLSIATLEALAAGLPAVVSSRPGLSVNGALEYLSDNVNGFITDGQPDSMAHAIGRIARDTSTFHRLSSAAIETGRRYAWEEAATELELAYEKVLGAAPPT